MKTANFYMKTTDFHMKTASFHENRQFLKDHLQWIVTPVFYNVVLGDVPFIILKGQV